MSRNLFFIAVFIFTYTTIHAQTIMLAQDVNKDTIIPTKGANRKNFTHSYIGYGFVIGKSDNEGIKTNFGSGEFIFGIRYKRKISNFYSCGFDINYNSKLYKIKQDSMKIFPNNVLHTKEKLVFHNIGLVLYNRFNFGKRGDYVGNFIDVGAYTDWGFNSQYVTYDKYAVVNAVSASNTKQIHSGLTYLNPINYGITARLGFNKFVLSASYRLSEIFETSYIYPELPRLILGVQLAIYR